MKKIIPKTIELPFESGKTYRTKFQTGERFTIIKIDYMQMGMGGGMFSKPAQESRIWRTKMICFWGVYENSPHLGECPIDPDRLHPETKTADEVIEVCDHCGQAMRALPLAKGEK